MLKGLITLARPMLLMMDAERAHELTIRTLEAGMYPKSTAADDPKLAVEVLGQTFPNPIGIAAGFDKDARVYDAIHGLGFGFSEVGTVTPQPQRGNPKPRVFRLIRDRAVINRLGFNSRGHELAHRMLARRSPEGIIGVNIGANKESEDKTADYCKGIERFYELADYFMVNISSPNTPGLRDLQAPAALDELLTRVFETSRAQADQYGRQVPIAVKIAPDIASEDLPAICERLVAHNVDAIAVSNTTLWRPDDLDPVFANEAGGLSGRPLFHRATTVLARVYQLTGGRIPLVGVGGIDSGATALAKIEAGASLLQIYTGLIYEGPTLIERIKSDLTDAIESAGGRSLTDLVGTKAETWAAQSLDVQQTATAVS